MEVLFLDVKETKKPLTLLNKCQELNNRDGYSLILCSDFKKAQKLQKIAEKNNINIPFPITIYELKKNKLHFRNLLIYDTEEILRSLLLLDENISVSLISILSNNKNQKEIKK